MSPPSASLTLGTVVCARASQVSSPVGEDLVVLELDTSMYYSLDPVGRRIFELLQVPTRLDAVVAEVIAEFEVDAETAAADTLELVGAMVAQRLVEPRPPHAT
jgi:hypothetical protein